MKIKPLVVTPEILVSVFEAQMSAPLLHMSDEGRNEDNVLAGLVRIFDPNGPHEMYELGDGEGIMVFRDIAPGFKCYVSFIVWGHKWWGKEAVREARILLADMAKKHGLIKMETQTADERVVRLARMIGFETEGYREKSFLRGENLYGVTLLGKEFPKEDKDV